MNEDEKRAWIKASAVDNASNVDDPFDTHPCGPGPTLHHSWLDGECQDCGATHDDDCVGCQPGSIFYTPTHEYIEPSGNEDEEEEPYDDSDDAYERYKDDIIESGGHWPPWRKD